MAASLQQFWPRAIAPPLPPGTPTPNGRSHFCHTPISATLQFCATSQINKKKCKQNNFFRFTMARTIKFSGLKGALRKKSSKICCAL
jgi:hypothetical protein